MLGVWEDVKSQLRDFIPQKSFSLWIDPITYLETKEAALVLSCPNKFSLKWITENYQTLLEERLRKITGEPNSLLVFKVQTPKKIKMQGEELKQAPRPTLPVPSHNGRNGSRILNDEFTFDRFVVGNCNEFAYSASKALASEKNLAYHSMFILANTGLGKSHLAQAIGHAVLEKDPDLRVYYITAEDFMNEMVTALKSKRIDDFKNKYRRLCDVLLLEEVQFLSGKIKTQIELSYTLDALTNDQKRIIFTSSQLPKNIPDLTNELSSRFNSAVITTLALPDYETRVKILEKKAAEHKLSLTPEIIHVLAEYLSLDVRQMESSLRCLKAKSELMKAKIDLSLAREVISAHIPEQNSVTLEEIKDLICRYFKVDPLMLKAKSRKKIYAYPRSVYVYLCRNFTGSTVEEIGRSLNRKHSTVLYTSEMVENKMHSDRKIKNQIDFLIQKLKDPHK